MWGSRQVDHCCREGGMHARQDYGRAWLVLVMVQRPPCWSLGSEGERAGHRQGCACTSLTWILGHKVQWSGIFCATGYHTSNLELAMVKAEALATGISRHYISGLPPPESLVQGRTASKVTEKQFCLAHHGGECTGSVTPRALWRLLY